jgi:hypothetical protein
MYTKIILAIVCLFPLFSFANPQKTHKDVDFEILYNEMPLFVTTFQECSLNSSSSIAIILSDGSRWIIKSNTPKELYEDIYRNWKVGDDIRIKKSEKKFILKSIYSPEFYVADLDLESNDTALYYIEKVDKNGYAILTHEGSEWIFGWLSAVSVQYWAPGQSVTINKGGFSGQENYYIINRNNGAICWASLVSW